MRFLQIGLGSMGKRRIRCLKALGYKEIIGFDLREDRCKEANDLYQIKTVSNLDRISWINISAAIISTPPDKHLEYMNRAVSKNVPCFVEASVILKGLSELNRRSKKMNILVAPSCTLRFYDPIKDIKKIVSSGNYGRLTNFTFHSGQYLPDWHPWEKVMDFYVSKEETGACREIVPFELTWIVDIAGYPKRVVSVRGKTMDVGAPIDDTYVLGFEFDQGFGSMIVDVVSRYATRSLILNMERGQIVWRWDDCFFKLYEADKQRWVTYNQKEKRSQLGYNKNIDGGMYIEELKHFISHVRGVGRYPHSLDDDIRILKILNHAEKCE